MIATGDKKGQSQRLKRRQSKLLFGQLCIDYSPVFFSIKELTFSLIATLGRTSTWLVCEYWLRCITSEVAKCLLADLGTSLTDYREGPGERATVFILTQDGGL